MWHRFTLWHRPSLRSIPLGALLFSSPVAIGTLVAPDTVAPGMLWLALQLMTGVSVLLYVLDYARYLHLRRAANPSADLGPQGYRIAPGRWVALMREDYQYRMTIQTAHGDRPTVLMLSRMARINPDRTDGWLRIEFPVPADTFDEAQAFAIRFNTLT